MCVCVCVFVCGPEDCEQVFISLHPYLIAEQAQTRVCYNTIHSCPYPVPGDGAFHLNSNFTSQTHLANYSIFRNRCARSAWGSTALGFASMKFSVQNTFGLKANGKSVLGSHQ